MQTWLPSLGPDAPDETCGNRKLQEFVKGQLNAPGGHAAPGLLASYQAGLAAALEPSRPLPEVRGSNLRK